MSGKRLLGWVLVLIAVIWIVSPSIWFLRGPLMFHGCGPGHSDMGSLRILPAFWLGFGALGWLLHLLLALWVWMDANQRGQNGFLWGLLVFFTSVVGLIVYLLLGANGAATTPPAASPQGSPQTPPSPPPRPPAAGSCRHCGARLDAGYQVCPYCGTPVQRRCPGCHRAVEASWKICPYCETRLD